MLFVLVCLVSVVCFVEGARVCSPDGDVVVGVEVKVSGDIEGCLFWRVSYKGSVILDESRLGLELKELPALMDGFEVVGVNRSSFDETWKPVYGERDRIRDNYNQVVVVLRDGLGRLLRLTVRVFDEGVAIRYSFGEQEKLQSFVIKAEHTQFRFTDDHAAWCVYSAQGVYSKASIDKVKANCERPLTVEIEGGPAVAIGEAALIDYARMRFRPVKGQAHTVESMLGSEVKVTAPYSTPWRVVMIADDVCELLENNYMMLNLNEPCAIEDPSWIKPGKVIREVSLTTAGGKACVDFAVDRGLQYVEYDAGWYGPEYEDASDATTITLDPKRSKGPLDLHEVIRYANSKDIGILVYVNRRSLEKQLDVILPLFKSWGIKGVKYGFVRVGDQKWTAWLHEAIAKAADNQLMVDIHDEYRPTGFSRTYPNLMTMEGIRGNECMPPAEHNLILPFTRFLCGAGDYTVCWYDGRVKGTGAHQLAAPVVYYSPLQFVFWYDRPSFYKGEKELDFFKYVPTVWDETKVVQGKVSEYVTIARRSGDDWFVGTMNAGKRRKLEIPLPFLQWGRKYTAHIYSDGKPDGSDRMNVSIKTMTVDPKTVITAEMAHNGGQAIRIVSEL